MFDSLRSRLALTNLLITLAGLAIVVLVFTNLAASRSEEAKRQELSKQSRAVATQVESLLHERGNAEALKAQILFDSKLLGERIIVVRRNGTITVDSSGSTRFDRGTWAKYDLQALQSGTSHTKALESKHLVLFQSPLYGTLGKPGKSKTRTPIGAVILVAHNTDVTPSMTSIIGVAAIAAATAVLVWLCIALYFTFSISRPLLRIINATTEMARGNYGTRVETRGHGEISRLATSFNAMASRIQQSNQVLKDFVANVSHDLRTPLTMIIGFSQAVVDGTAGPGEVRESAAVIHDEALKMQVLVDDLLQLTRLESGLMKLDKQPTKLRVLVEDTLQIVAMTHSGRPIARLRNLVPPDLPMIDVDSERIERVFRNLLNNALQYTPPEGQVSVKAQRAKAGWVEISVSDDGFGISATDLPRIFERFYRSDKGRVRGDGHSGLGLAIVREIVEAHGGAVSVESQIGRGTTFRFTVPIAEGRRVLSSESSAHEALPNALPR